VPSLGAVRGCPLVTSFASVVQVQDLSGGNRGDISYLQACELLDVRRPGQNAVACGYRVRFALKGSDTLVVILARPLIKALDGDLPRRLVSVLRDRVSEGGNG